jgi:cytochrome b subunit of formate dehydrogenase
MSRDQDKTIFQRIWYALAVLTLLGLAVTGFEIHGSYRLVGFRVATLTHDVLFSFILFLAVLYIFWSIVTEHWRRYLPSSLARMPPVQRYINVGLDLTIWGVMALSGALYIGFVIFHDAFAENVNRAAVAYVHTAGAYLVLALIVWHLYFKILGRK